MRFAIVCQRGEGLQSKVFMRTTAAHCGIQSKAFSGCPCVSRFLLHTMPLARPTLPVNQPLGYDFKSSVATAVTLRDNDPDCIEDPLCELGDKVVELCLAEKDTDSEWRSASDSGDSGSLLFDAKFLSWICENASDAPKTPLTPATFPSACKPPATAGREVASTRKSVPVALKIPENYPSALNSPGTISASSMSPGSLTPGPSPDPMSPLLSPGYNFPSPGSSCISPCPSPGSISFQPGSGPVPFVGALGLANEQLQNTVPAKPVDGKFPISENGRCSHNESWSRLRGKRGHSYFVCGKCGLGWRQPTKVFLPCPAPRLPPITHLPYPLPPPPPGPLHHPLATPSCLGPQHGS